MNQDNIDVMNELWRRELPDLDPSALETLGRVLVLAKHLERRVEAVLKTFELNLGQYDILATLRRQGAGARMTPTELYRSLILSSGAMTNRLDRLEEAGLIVREPDPDDRRGVVVGLTEKGRKVIEKAAAARFEEAKRSQPPLTERQTTELTSALRVWLLKLGEE